MKGVDGIVFVADSQVERIESNIESLEGLEAQLAETEKRTLEEVPFVLQYNKRDLPNAMSVADLDRALNPRAHPTFEAVASHGTGVFDTLKGVVRCSSRLRAFQNHRDDVLHHGLVDRLFEDERAHQDRHEDDLLDQFDRRVLRELTGVDRALEDARVLRANVVAHLGGDAIDLRSLWAPSMTRAAARPAGDVA